MKGRAVRILLLPGQTDDPLRSWRHPYARYYSQLSSKQKQESTRSRSLLNLLDIVVGHGFKQNSCRVLLCCPIISDDNSSEIDRDRTDSILSFSFFHATCDDMSRCASTPLCNSMISASLVAVS
jgi:hypothetical protein